MNWMLIVSGVAAAVVAFALLGLWSNKSKAPKGEVSMMATVKRIFESKSGELMGIFIARGQEMEFSVPSDIGRQLQAGERGVLTFRGEEFVYFVPRQQMFENDNDGHLPAVS